MKNVRDEFFAGEIGHLSTGYRRHVKQEIRLHGKLTPEIMMSRIHERLRKVVVRACSNSPESARIVYGFERYLVHCFRDERTSKLPSVLSESLLEPPTVTRRASGHTIVRFYFDSDSTFGGFHRLLLHAVSQFHGLEAVSSTADIESSGKRTAVRLLAVTGSLSGAEFRLSDYATDAISAQPHNKPPMTRRSIKPSEVSELSESLTSLRV